MDRKVAWTQWVAWVSGALIALALFPSSAQASQGGAILTGRVLDVQGRPVDEAHISIWSANGLEPIAETESGEEGFWTLRLGELDAPELIIEIALQLRLTESQTNRLLTGGGLDLPPLQLERKIDGAFWAASLIFLGVLAVIALERLHSTTAALAGLSAIFLVTFTAGSIDPDWFIFDFERALSYINWEVIFLVMGMMIIIAIIEGTGIFQWTTFQAYRLSRGRAWLLVLILMLLTALASALLDNFTTMLLMTPISLQIGMALGINPLAFIIPEVLASNVGGITTLIGTPTNILIGAYAGIGFQDFLVYQTPGVLLAMAGMAGYVLYHYREEWHKHPAGISKALYERLERNARLRDQAALWKSGLVFLLVIVGFVVGERLDHAGFLHGALHGGGRRAGGGADQHHCRSDGAPGGGTLGARHRPHRPWRGHAFNGDR